MTKLSRIEEVEAIIRRKRRMAIKELEQLTYSSASTLRRDLIYLEEHGLIRRARGEVFLNSSNNIPPRSRPAHASNKEYWHPYPR